MGIIPDPEILLARQAIHDRDAFAELYRCHVVRVYRYFIVHVGDVSDAQDLTSQTFLTALESIRGYGGKGSFAAWLLGIAHHKMVDYYRRKRATVSLDSADELGLPSLPMDEIVDTRLQLERTMSALSQLTEDRAEAMRLHIFGALTVKEVGQVMKRSPAASKMLIYRALQNLKMLLLNKES